MKLTEPQKAAYKTKILGIARYFDAFCTEHHLQYFCIAGTAIGALRHHGLIPWDDDIDLAMPRPDYERFLQLAATELSTDYDIFEHRLTPAFHQSICKLCDAHTSLLDNGRRQCIIGAFVDIFPLDGLPDTDARGRTLYFQRYLRLRQKAEAINTRFTFRDLLSALYRGRFSHAGDQLLSHLYHISHKANDIYPQCDAFLAQFPFDSANYVAYFGTNRGPKVISPKEWFSDYTYTEFEDLKLRLPIGVDQYLRRVYGDYMTPPPPKDRIALHSYGYLNLEHRVSLQEALQEVLS